MRYMICHWATNRSDPQNLLSITLDVPLHLVPEGQIRGLSFDLPLQGLFSEWVEDDDNLVNKAICSDLSIFSFSLARQLHSE